MHITKSDGLWWPDSDRKARRAIIDTLGDLDAALRYVPGRSLCVQAGGNCGVWPSRLANEFEEVWTIEPDLDNYRCLVRNMPARVRPIWAALGDRPGTTGLELIPKNVGAHFVNGEGRIAVITIDELELEACDLIVLDIEGMEPLALQGARETIYKFRPVLMVEDKGLSERYGVPGEWSRSWPGYMVAARPNRDVILTPC